MPALQKYEAGNWEAKKPELTRSEASSFALLSADFLWLWNRTVQLYFHSSSTIEGKSFLKEHFSNDIFLTFVIHRRGS